MSTPAGPAASFRFAVNVTPKDGILDPQGRAVEQSLPHLGVTGVGHVRVGRRVEMTVEAPDEAAARAALGTLPFVKAGALTFEVVGLLPYDGWARLFAPED
jgi:phosphoribosylformylglycinamidine synthase PurS subunit